MRHLLHTTSIWIVFTLTFAAAFAPAREAGPADLRIIKQRIVAGLVPGGDPRPVVAMARQYMAALGEDGSWPDIDYQDAARSNWKTAAHTQRLVAMAKAYRTERTDLAANAGLRARILAGYDYWIRLDPKNPNWWHNQIGQPTTIGELLILMESDLTAAQLAAGINILKRSTWSTWTGQNLVWGTSVQVVRGCLEDAPRVVAEAYDRMYREIRIAADGEEGIQADFSFHQHGPLLYSGGYGAAFTGDCSRFVALAAGTAFAAPDDRLRILEGYVLDGQLWMTWGKVYDYSVTGRELTRRGKSAAGLAPAVERLAGLGSSRQQELADFARLLQGDATARPVVGNRHFWRSDYMSHRRSAWMASVRMFSRRLMNTDGYINGENKKSHHLSDGASLLYLSGREYADIFPLWDWLRIPGTTCEQETSLVAEKVCYRGSTSFVGGVSDGTCGLAAMHLRSGRLEARKAWAFFDEEYVCLGAGITCDSDHPVYTSVNQCWLTGPVAVSTQDRPLETGSRRLQDLRWVHHAGVGYLFPAGGSIHIANQPQSGAWSEIGTGSSQRLTGDIFSLGIDHGRHPDGATYQYIVMPSASSETIAARAANPAIGVLANSADLQAVLHKRLNLVAVAFLRPGVLASPLGTIQVDQPCLLLVKRTADSVQITISNPENRSRTVNVGIDLPLAGAGAEAVESGRTRIRFELPGGLEAGGSILRTFGITPIGRGS